MAKLKISTYFPHIFSKLSSNFLQLFQMTKLDCFQHRSTNVCKNTVKVKAAFCSNEFLLCHKCVIFWLHGFCVNQRNGFGCVAHKRIYSQWLQRCMMPSVFFVATPERNATATQKEALWWDCFWRHRLKTNRWPARRTLCQLILPPPWKQTYSRKMFSFKAQNTAGTKLLPERDGLRQHVRAWGETIFLLHCRLIQMASANRLDQTGSTKLAGHQNSLLLRVRLAGKKIAVAVRPHCLDKPDTQE